MTNNPIKEQVKDLIISLKKINGWAVSTWKGV